MADRCPTAALRLVVLAAVAGRRGRCRPVGREELLVDGDGRAERVRRARRGGGREKERAGGHSDVTEGRVCVCDGVRQP